MEYKLSFLSDFHSIYHAQTAQNRHFFSLTLYKSFLPFVFRSSCILLLDHATFDILLKVDDVTSLDTSPDLRVGKLSCNYSPVKLFNETSVFMSVLLSFQVIAFSESRVTTMMALGEELWVGLGNGQVLIFDVTRNDEIEDEGFVVLDEHEGEYQFLFVFICLVVVGAWFVCLFFFFLI